MGKKIRLDRYLSEMNKGSRSAVREAVKRGRVLVNGERETGAERKIDLETDVVCWDHVPVAYREREYYMLNKPRGVVSATEDRVYKTVVGLLGDGRRKDLFPVGRLDIDTEGLLLITNDGELAHQLLSPQRHVDRQYYARISGELPEDAAARFAEGLFLEDGTRTKPAELHVLDARGTSAQVYLTVQEGKFHQVKRMFGALGCRVEYLKRTAMGPLCLDRALAPGEYRGLTGQEVARLRQSPNYAGSVGGDLKRKKAAIFDLDGTLVDSMWMWHDIDVEYLGRFGYGCPPLLQREIEGMSLSETAAYFKEHFHIPDSLEEIKAAWVRMSIEKYRREVPLKKGVKPLLDYMKAHGIRMGIATSNGTEMVRAVLESQEVADYFDCVMTACQVAHGKPAPDIYLEVAGSLGVAPEDCMVFEDIPAGIQAGKAAGMAVCSVEDPHSAWIRAEKISLADYHIKDYEEILKEL